MPKRELTIFHRDIQAMSNSIAAMGTIKTTEIAFYLAFSTLRKALNELLYSFEQAKNAYVEENGKVDLETFDEAGVEKAAKALSITKNELEEALVAKHGKSIRGAAAVRLYDEFLNKTVGFTTDYVFNPIDFLKYDMPMAILFPFNIFME